MEGGGKKGERKGKGRMAGKKEGRKNGQKIMKHTKPQHHYQTIILLLL